MCYLARSFHRRHDTANALKEAPFATHEQEIGSDPGSGLSWYSAANGGDVMKTKPFLTEIPRSRKSIPCFIRGCYNASEHVVRFKHGTATLQVCLCDECVNKSRESILRGLGIQTESVFN